MACSNLRKDDELFRILHEKEDVVFKKAASVDYNRLVQIPTYKWCYERYFTILNELPNNMQGRKNNSLNRLVKELVEVYLYCDLCPQTDTGIKKNLEKRLNILETIRKEQKRKKEDQSKTLGEKKKDFLKDLSWGINILNKNRQEYLGIILGEDESNLFRDNCEPYVDGNGKSVVKYTAKVEGRLHPSAKKAKKRLERLYKLDKYYEKEKQNCLLVTQKGETDYTEDFDNEEDTRKPVDQDEEWLQSAGKKRRVSSISKDHTMSLRNNDIRMQDEESEKFPELPIRSLFKKFNSDILEQLARLEAVYRLPARISREVLVDIANNLFQQHWVILPETTNIRTNEEGETEEESKEEDDIDWKFVMPDRKTIRNYIEDAAILNFEHVAETMIMAKENGGVLTLGTDDTVKLAGRTSFDVKTGIITVIGNTKEGERERQTLSLGFQENLSHQGVDSAETVKMFLGQVGACVDLDEQEVLDMIDFFISDRAKDNISMLEELNVSDEDRLDCNAHILLCITSTADKVFRDVESSAGLHKLISEGAISGWNNGNSIWYLGLNAFSTLFSPSKSQESVNVYRDYKKFLNDLISDPKNSLFEKANFVLSKPFLGFNSNRFGRLADLSTLFLDHLPLVIEFFDQFIDENQNKLQLACFCYLRSEWFKLSCQVVDNLNEILVQPLQLALGIDKYKKVRSEYRNWFGLKELIPELLDSLDAVLSSSKTGVEELKKKVFTEVKVAVQRQMSTVKFYSSAESMTQEKLEKIIFTPLTNSGCESNFGDLTYDVTRSAGSDMKMKTFSNKNVIRKNRLFDSKKWKELSERERAVKWKWARNSTQAKKVRQIGKTYFDAVKKTTALSLVEKERKKITKRAKSMKLLETCKTWGGPVTEASLDMLDELDEHKLIIELRYLRATVAPNIREKRKEGKKFIRFNKDQLINQIKNSIKPVSDNNCDVEVLLSNVFGLNHESTDNVPPTMMIENETVDDFDGHSTLQIVPGVVGMFSGPLDEIQVGVVIAVGSESMLQLYESRRYGYIPGTLEPQPITEWLLVEEIEEYQYVNYASKPDLVFLKF